MGFFPTFLLDVLVRVLDHDDCRVHHCPHGNGNAPETHDVGVDPLPFHDNEANEHGHRQGEDDHQGTAQMKQEDDAHNRYYQTFFQEGFLKVVNGPEYQR